ncbi:acyltransferase [Kordiimonas sp.]|uniref:acyltransferase n=1 Tax=Kordiimonas sp. TaxID=1970157 RepID=UPI003A8F4C9B
MISLYRRIKFWATTKRIGPDIPLNHWMLQFPGLGRWLARRKLAHIGEDSFVRPYSYLVETYHIAIGDRVVIRPHTMLMADEYARITIGNDVLIGAGVHMYVNNHRYDRTDVTIASQGYYPSEDVTIEDDVWIGANAVILPGVRVGRHSVIAAGSVVTKSVDPFSVYGGVPARKLKDIPQTPTADSAPLRHDTIQD